MKKLLFSVAAMLIFMQHPEAQQHIFTIDSVIIKENRFHTPLAKQNRDIQVLDKETIRALPVRSVSELLSYVSGVDLRQRGPWGVQADVSIDGGTFDEVLILVNGMKMSDPQTGHHMMNLPIPLNAIDHIEILRGPAASKYGVNALAGVINIITALPAKNTVEAQAYGGSSFKQDTATGDTYYSWGAQASAAWAAKNQSHILSLAHDEGNGYRYNTGFNANRLFYQNHITLDTKNSIEATGGYINNAFGANGFYSAPADANSTETVQTAIGSVAYTCKPTQNITITPRVSYRYNSDDYIFIRQKPEVYHNYHETNVWTAEVQGAIKLNKGTLGAGLEYRSEDIRSNSLGYRDRSNTGIYAEYKHTFTEKLGAGVGVYANYNTDYGWQLFPGADVGYKISNKLKLFANTSAGQRLPTYTDLYYKGPANTGNDQLKPEFGRYAEGGLQYRDKVLLARAVYFYRAISDFIDWVKTANTDPWQPQNFQDIQTKGISLQAEYALSEHMHLPSSVHSTLNGSYTYLQPEIVTPANELSKYTIEALRHQVVVTSRNMLFHKLLINLTARYQYRISANDYTLLDARIGYQWAKWSVYADANNLLDTKYKETGAVQLPGRWFTAGVKMALQAK